MLHFARPSSYFRKQHPHVHEQDKEEIEWPQALVIINVDILTYTSKTVRKSSGKGNNNNKAEIHFSKRSKMT